MKTEQEVIKKMRELIKEIEQEPARSYQRKKLISFYNALHWVLLE